MEDNNLENKSYKPKRVKKVKTEEPKKDASVNTSNKVAIIGIKAPLEDGREYTTSKANAEILVNSGAAKYAE